ncbi:MAG: M20/M25/M40 family metallo-hydrolase [Thermoanaerobaculia bacterium]
MKRSSTRIAFSILTLLLFTAAANAAVVGDVREWRRAHAKPIIEDLVSLVSIPNVARDAADIEKNAAKIESMFRARGVTTRLLRVEGAPPVVFGRLDTPGATRTVVFYAHYDGQPAVATQGWKSAPWTPVLRDGLLDQGARDLPWSALDGKIDPEWRIYARSVSDDKAPIIAILAALDALKATGHPPTVNLRFLFEGEEEAGSPHLAEILTQNRDLLHADAWLFCDGPVHQSRRLQVVFGARGVTGLELTVYGPTRALHSGHYGNWAPNPASMLSNLLASMRDDDGRVLIDGFYDRVRPLSTTEKAAVAAIPDVDEELRHDLGLARSEANDARLVERIMIPAMNIRGLESASVGENARNAIPTEARASIDFRLVPDVTPAVVHGLVEAHLRKKGYFIVHDAPDQATRLAHPKIVRLDWDEGYPGFRTPMDLTVSKAVITAIQETSGDEIVKLPILGGSLPLEMFDRIFGVPLIVTPMVNHDNNQHAANENLRIANLWEGIDMMANLMARLGRLWR